MRKAAGEGLAPRKPLTGPGTARRSVCKISETSIFGGLPIAERLGPEPNKNGSRAFGGRARYRNLAHAATWFIGAPIFILTPRCFAPSGL